MSLIGNEETFAKTVVSEESSNEKKVKSTVIIFKSTNKTKD
jgi:hypothetical protein